MMNNVHFLSISFILLACNIFAQHSISSAVLNKNDSTPITFAHISIKHKPIQTLTNDEGHFTLSGNFQDSDTLQVSKPGYKASAIQIASFQQKQEVFFLSDSMLSLNTNLESQTEIVRIIEESLASLQSDVNTPHNKKLYYREARREAGKIKKFADGILSVNYLKDGNVAIQVNQSRTVAADRDKISSLLPVEKILTYDYVDAFANFVKKPNDYNFYAAKRSAHDNDSTLIIKPRKDTLAAESLLNYALIKIDGMHHIKEAKIELDSTANKRTLTLPGGNKIEITKKSITIIFDSFEGKSYVAAFRFELQDKLTMNGLLFKKYFVSEYQTLKIDFHPDAIPEKRQFKKYSLFDNGNKYDFPFWTTKNLIGLSQDEKEAIAKGD